ncbi:MAG: metallophosphoesterase, partial [Acidimicrobiales bacterium]|nr:metallophosphoesterase [Acidimicrobiales bacterium]
IDPAAAQELASDRTSVQRFETEATDELRSLVVRWAWRAALVALVAGALAGALVWPRRVLPPVVGAVAALTAVSLLLAATWFDFSRSALRDPEYRGALQEAPAVLAAIDRNWGGLEAVPGRLRALASNITELYATVGADAGDTSTDDEVRIIHISDVHSNPIGVELARGLATGFNVDAIIDTGDLTSFGLPVESRVGALVQDMPVPYYFVPGNHDTRANRASIAAFPNVTLLDGDVVDIGGVRVLGVADPAVTANGEDSDAAANDERDDQAAEVAEEVAAEEPDVLAVSTVRQAADAFGEVPLVIAGNTHKRSDETVDGTRVLTVGSTGATGLGSLTENREGSYEAQILRLRAGRLVAIDYVTFTGVSGDYTISRTVVVPETGGRSGVPDRSPSVSSSTSTSSSAPTSTSVPATVAAP